MYLFCHKINKITKNTKIHFFTEDEKNTFNEVADQAYLK